MKSNLLLTVNRLYKFLKLISSCLYVENGSDVSSKNVEEINPRQSGKISVKFTERHFPTPSRESLAADEDAVSSLIALFSLSFFEVHYEKDC